MNFKRRSAVVLAACLLLLLMTVGLSPVLAAEIIVYPGDTGIWSVSNYDNFFSTSVSGTTHYGSSGEFTSGPATPPAGTGSFRQQIGTDGDDAVRIQTSEFNGDLLSTITQLEYATYVAQTGSGGQATYIQINIDLDNNGTRDDILFFEPVYQTGSYSGATVPNQCPGITNCVDSAAWQTWDADAGGWWNLNAGTFGPPLITYAQYVLANPTARFVTDRAGFQLVTGFGHPAWVGFTGSVDNVTINLDTYDFELVLPDEPEEPEEPETPGSTNTEDDDTPAAPGGIAQTFDCTALGLQTNAAMTASGTVGNVSANGLTGNTFCHVIALNGAYVSNPGEIGSPEVINQGVVQAVDVFGMLPGGTSVIPFSTPIGLCLRGAGTVFFLSAADINRTPVGLGASQSGGYTCVSVPGSGTVVLVGTMTSAAPAATVEASGTAAGSALTGCSVTTTNAVRLRQEPNTSSGVITTLPFSTTLQATDRVDGWLRVIYGSGQGWVSAEFVDTSGTCGA